MSAIRLYNPASIDQLRSVDMTAPGKPGAGEILVRLHASSLNYHDLAVVKGGLPVDDGRIPLSDGAGEVLEVGEGVNEFAVGDRVIATFFPQWLDGDPAGDGFATVPGDGIDGYARELVVAPAQAFTPAPKGYSHAQAATLSCAGLTAWRALVVNGQLKSSETVLVQGTGGVSIFALQFAKALGATVIATSSSDEKLERLRALGADHLVNYRSDPEWGVRALEFTNGRGVDHTVEVGGGGTLNQSMIATRLGGHIALIGVLTGRQAPVETGLLMRKELRVIGLTVGNRRHQLDMVKSLEGMNVEPVIDSHFPLADLAEAFRYQESGRHFGKIVIDI